MQTESKLRFLGMIMLAGALLLPAGRAEACDCSVLPTLESAFEYSVLGFGNNDITMSGSAFADNGNIGLASGGKKVTMSGGSTIDGYIHHHSGTSTDLWSAGAAGSGTAVKDMSQPESDAHAFSTAMAAFPPTATLGGISNSQTFNGNGCINIIRVNGDISLGGSDTITFNGTDQDYFIFNVYGGISFSGDGALVLNGGVKSNHIFFNVLTSGNDVTISGDSSANATFYTETGKVTASGGGASKGAFYADGMDLSGSASFEGSPFACDCTSIDPVLLGTNVQRPAAPSFRGSGNSHFLLASFDYTAEEGTLEMLRIDATGDIYDKNGQTAVDASTNKFKTTRTPYWEGGALMAANSSRVGYTTLDIGSGPERVSISHAAVDATALGITAVDYPLFKNYPASGVNTQTEARDAVIAYLLGKDGFDENNNANFTEMRSSSLGPILHSNVLLIDGPRSVFSYEDGYSQFASDYEKRKRIVYAGGGSDGWLHAFDAGAWFDPSDPLLFEDGTGAEVFAYVPGLLLDEVRKSAYDDTIVEPFVDGNIGAADAWLGDDGANKTHDEWATVLVASMYNGGRGYLALDVTNPAATTDLMPHGTFPKFLWEFTHANLGFTWSAPIITRVKLEGPLAGADECGQDDGEDPCEERWVAIFGGGYEADGNPNHASYVDPSSGAWRDVSKGIFMVALDTGELIASVQYDGTGTNGPAEMVYSLPSTPAVLDLNADGFADVVYIGDLGGQMWKWDISDIGDADLDADPEVDNWEVGIFFNAVRHDLGSGNYRYRSMFFPPAAALLDSTLRLAFGTGEREDLLYTGVAGDENNRFYVVEDPNPTGTNAFTSPVRTESDLTDITGLASDPDSTDDGFFFVADEGEKFIGDVIIFGGFVITASFQPDPNDVCSEGLAFVYLFDLEAGGGFFNAGDAGVSGSGRTLQIGSGLPSSPRLSLGGGGDALYMQTSTGELVKLDAPERSEQAGLVYWKQDF